MEAAAHTVMPAAKSRARLTAPCSMVHTVFAKSYPEASEKVEVIKRGPKECVMGCQDGMIDPSEWVEAFVARW